MYSDLPERHASILHTYAQGEHFSDGIHNEIQKFQNNEMVGTLISVEELDRLHEVEKIAVKMEGKLEKEEQKQNEMEKQKVKVNLVSIGTQTGEMNTCTSGCQTVSKWFTLDSIGNAATSLGGSSESNAPLSQPIHSETMSTQPVESSVALRHAQTMPVMKQDPELTGMARRLPSRCNTKRLNKKSLSSPYNDDSDWIKLEKDAKRIENNYQKSIPGSKKPIKKNKVLLSALEVNKGRPGTTQQRADPAPRQLTNMQPNNNSSAMSGHNSRSPLGSSGFQSGVYTPEEQGEERGAPVPDTVIINADAENEGLVDFLNQYDDLAQQIQTQSGKVLSSPLLMEKRSRAQSGAVSPVGPRNPASTAKTVEEESDRDNLVDYLNSYDELATQLIVRLEESEEEMAGDSGSVRDWADSSFGSAQVGERDLPPIASSNYPEVQAYREGQGANQRPRSPSVTSVDSLLSIDSQGSIGSGSTLVSTGSPTRSRKSTTGSGSPTRRRLKSKAEPTTNKERKDAKENPGLAVVNRARNISSSSKAYREKPFTKTEKQLTER